MNRVEPRIYANVLTLLFTDIKTPTLEFGLIDRERLACGCDGEWALFSMNKRNPTPVWAYRAIRYCRPHKPTGVILGKTWKP